MGIEEVEKGKMGSDGTRMEGRAWLGQGMAEVAPLGGQNKSRMGRPPEHGAGARNDPITPSQGVPAGEQELQSQGMTSVPRGAGRDTDLPPKPRSKDPAQPEMGAAGPLL